MRKNDAELLKPEVLKLASFSPFVSGAAYSA